MTEDETIAKGFDHEQYVELYNGLKVLNANTEQLKGKFAEVLSGGGVTIAINAEKMWMVEKNILNLQDLKNTINVVDGVAAIFGVKPDTNKSLNIEKIDLPMIAKNFCCEFNIPILVIGGIDLANKLAVENIKRDHVSPNNVGGLHGYYTDSAIMDTVNVWAERHRQMIVFLGLGSPKQEKLALKLWRENKNILVICCGGAINIMAGLVARAPDVIVRSKVEWLYRLILEPKKRIKRFPRLLFILFKLVQYHLKNYVIK